MIKAYEPSGKIFFEETLKFPRWLFIVLVLLVLSTVAIIIGAAIATGHKTANEGIWIALAVTLPVELIMIYVFFAMRLEKIVTSNGLYFRWSPLQKKYSVIEGNEIEKIEYRKAPSSYGSSWVPGYGKVHNLSKEGLQCYLVSGKKYFFG